MAFITYITCSDCRTEWIDRCGLCKREAWQKKRARTKKAKRLKPPKPIKLSHDEIVAEREYWSQFHPRRVVSLIMRGHDAACACCYTLDSLTFDHIKPLVLGSKNTLCNGQILCYHCNQLKGGRLISLQDLRREL